VDWTYYSRSSWARGLGTLLVLLAVVLFLIKISDNPSNTSPIWLTGFAALLASFVALFGEAVRGWIWRPNLTVSHVPGPDYCEKVTVLGMANGRILTAKGYYFRLLISNKGPRRAEKVEVLVTSLRKQQPDGSRPMVRRYSMNLKWTHVGTNMLDGLSPKMERFCDIGHCLYPPEREALHPIVSLPNVDANTAILSLDLEAQANYPIHLIEPGKYELSLSISASNHEPINKVLEIEVTGKWSDDLGEMLRGGIRLRLI
jgi:hypothetical protein